MDLLFSLTLPVSADIIWEPADSFYEKHSGECTYVERSYVLAGYAGTVDVFTAPGGVCVATLENGIQGIIQFTWEGRGVTWGYLYGLADKEVEGWVAMDDLALVYDSEAFIEDHQAKVQQLEEDQDVPVDFREAVLYSYPGGPTTGDTLKEDRDYMPFSKAFHKLYTDKNGLRWGYIGYYMGSLGAWACLDDPMNEGLDTEIVPVSPSPAQVRGSATVAAAPSMLPAAIGLAAAVTVVTLVLILKLKRRNR